MTLPAGFSKTKKAGRREYLRARIGADGRVEVFASEGSGRISGLAWATGLVELPDAAMTITPGDPVRFLSYAGLGLGRLAPADQIDLRRAFLGGRDEFMPRFRTEMRHVDHRRRIGRDKPEHAARRHPLKPLSRLQDRQRAQ